MAKEPWDITEAGVGCLVVWSGAFCSYAVVVVVGFIWLYFCLPEPKGLSLKVMAALLQKMEEFCFIVNKDNQVNNNNKTRGESVQEDGII